MSILFYHFASVRWLAPFRFSFFKRIFLNHAFDTFIILTSLDVGFFFGSSNHTLSPYVYMSLTFHIFNIYFTTDFIQLLDQCQPNF